MKPVNWLSVYFREYDGYGHSGLQMVRALVEAGVDLRTRAPQNVDEKLPEPLRSAIKSIISKGPMDADTVVYYALPSLFYELPAYQVGFTQFETNRLPGYWPEDLNRMHEVWTTCDELAEVFRQSGVTRPIYTVPLGVTAEHYAPARRRKTEPFLFMHTGLPEPRKGAEIAIKAYRLAFGDYEKVRLVLKGTGIPQELNRRQPQGVDFMLGRYPYKHMRDLLLRCHCFVYPTRGEGWGMIPLEAMCTGIPTLLTSFLGTAMFAKYGIPVRHDLVEADYYPHLNPCGEWAEPDIEDMAEKMLDVYENYEEHEERATENARAVAEEFTWAKSAAVMVKHLARIEAQS